jgi:hypothetical protein
MNKAVTIIMAAAVMLAAGCATQPSRAQTQTFKGNTFYVMVPAGNVSNAVAQAKSQVGDLFCQNMMIETGGDESNTQTSRPSVDVPVDVSWGGGAAGAAGAAASLANKAAAALGGSKTTTPAAAAKDAACAGEVCTDAGK